MTKTNSAHRQSPMRVFVDYLTATTESGVGCLWILQGVKKLKDWAWVHFNPPKSRLMVLRRRKVDDKFKFNVTGVTIPTFTEKTQTLGKEIRPT